MLKKRIANLVAIFKKGLKYVFTIFTVDVSQLNTIII